MMKIRFLFRVFLSFTELTALAVFFAGSMTLAFTPESRNATETIFPMTWRREPGLRIELERNLALAPDVQKTDSGLYRMYYTVTGRGVGSASSRDGLTWSVDPGLRIVSRRHTPDYRTGQLGFDIGHPWLVRLSDRRWRMYLQANTGLGTPLRIISAVSRNGIDFQVENGTRVDIGAASGPPPLDFAGHGRAWRRNDGTWAMVFSGNLRGNRKPSNIMRASSSDGLKWSIDDPCVYERGHDPAILRMDDGTLVMVFAYLRDRLMAGFSADGLNWSPAQTLTLLDEHGSAVDEIGGDVALFRRPDGGLRMLANGRRGIESFVPAE